MHADLKVEYPLNDAGITSYLVAKYSGLVEQSGFQQFKVHLAPKNKFLAIKSLDSGIPEKWSYSFVLALIIE